MRFDFVHKEVQCFLALFCCLWLGAAMPAFAQFDLNQVSTWQLNTANYQNSMTVTGSLLINNEVSTDPADRVAAYVLVNGTPEIRGAAAPEYVASADSYLVYLTALSNVSAGEEILFQIYDASANAYFTSPKSLPFVVNTNYGTASQPFLIADNEAPSSIELSSNSVAENSAAGTFVATITTTDNDGGQSFTYSLVTGEGDADNSAFRISTDSLFTTQIFNFEQSTTRSIRIKSTDTRSGFVEQVFVVQIINRNDAPSALGLSTLSFSEALPKGGIVATITATDEDAAEQLSYSLQDTTAFPDNILFSVEGNQLVLADTVDFEQKTQYLVGIEVTDIAGATAAASFNLNVEDATELPSGISLTNNTVAENQPVGTIVGQLQAQGVAGEITFSLLQTPDAAAFYIDGQQLRTAQSFDFEAKSVYQLQVQSSDRRGDTFVQNVVIQVTDANDAPTAVALELVSVNENLPLNLPLTALLTTDPDAEDAHTYTLINGAGSEDNEKFRIEEGQLYAQQQLDFETQPAYRIRVRSTDAGGASVEQILQLQLINQNDAPTGAKLEPAVVNENVPVGTVVGVLTAIDQDRNERHNFRLISGVPDNAAFRVSGNTLVTGTNNLDAEGQNEYIILVEVEDIQGALDTATIQLQVLNINEAPLATADQLFFVNENAEAGTVVGEVEATDPEGGAVTYALVNTPGTNPAERPFNIDAATGELLVNNSRALDYEQTTAFVLQVRLSDTSTPALETVVEVVVELQDVIEAELPVNNYISPNADGDNDTFEIRNLSLYSGYTLRIYTAEGAEVYGSSNYDNSFSGSDLPQGVYYYIFSNNTSGKVFKGYITLIK